MTSVVITICIIIGAWGIVYGIVDRICECKEKCAQFNSFKAYMENKEEEKGE